ncbi:MAG: A17 family peptidase, partial [Bacteroidota bacterium]
MPGPSLIADLRKVLIRFERHAIAVAADVSEMYLQILLRSEDQAYHHFLWEDENGLVEYRFTRFPFGNRCAPFIALYTVREHARELLGEESPAFETICDSTLMDDTLDSFATVEEARAIIHTLKEMYAGIGMTLRKFLSSDPEALTDVSEEDRSPSLSINELVNDPTADATKALGLLYAAVDDAYYFKHDLPTWDRWTKRRMLSCFASLFDPLGKIMPVVSAARILFQDTWRSPLGWDEDLPADIAEAWNAWREGLAGLDGLVLERCLIQVDKEVFAQIMHCFVDASEKAYAAVAYILTEYEDDSRSVRQIFARAKVAQNPPETIPRLELRAAVLGIEVAALARDALGWGEEQVIYWSDSKTALQWITNERSQWKVFVANRVKKIRNRSELKQWFWVPTAENPADLPSRGRLATQLRDEWEFWHRGPSFLEGDWPEQPCLRKYQVPAEAAKEVRVMATSVEVEPNTFPPLWEENSRWDLQRCSSFHKHVRIIARVISAIRKWRN